MDLSEYLPMFLAECREHTQELNLAVVRLEEVPDEPGTVDEIFRVAHTLKGMSATMGFEGMAALTHQMEDVFELLRQRTGGLEREAIDVLLECLDALERAIDSIDAGDGEQLDPKPLIERLQGLVRERTPVQELESEVVGEAVPAVLPGGVRVVHVAVELDPAVMMPSVRAYMALATAEEHGQIVESRPAQDAVDGFEGRTVEVWIATENELGAIEAALSAVPDVASAKAAEVQVEEKKATAAAPAAKKSQSVRVDAERLDQLMHLMGELVVQRTHVEALAAGAEVPGLHQAMAELTRCSHALQTMVMQVRMIEVEAVFLRFPRLVRDLSGKLGKDVELKLVGQDTELDRTVVDTLGDPLVHLVRNALDHGLEGPEERAAAGKPKTGVLEISARHAGGNVVITVSDDGRGIDAARVAARAVERGLITAEAADAIDGPRAAELLFAPGFSTAETTSDISGRGVGMDAVRTKVRELGGEVTLTSELGSGTTAQIRLPLTLAIMSALLVETGDRSFAIPIDRIERTLRLADYPVRSVAGTRMLVMPDGTLPLLDGGTALDRSTGCDPDHAVVVHGNDRRVALGVTRLVGQRELVTRPLPADLADDAPVSGAAVLSSGEIALLVDCDALTTIDLARAA
jgi:two-component system, chemotaxis family, sensor kinase CheA